ncbi:tandem-95 repeat protein, partial [Colwellia sp. BRX10-3]|uniref:tandem-95 repeat protein n=1 Tax=Colwellia sp. BRX10-3 TaxID=2759844 RepID=UPI0015F72735
FIYEVLDGNGGKAQGSVTLNINSINDVPVLGNDSYIIDEDIALNILVGDANQLLSNDSDADGDTLTVNSTPISNVSNGSLTLNSDGSFNYIPTLNFNGTDSFTYQVSDGNGGIAQGNVTLTVSAVNDIPVAVADAYSVNEDIVLNILATDANNLLNNDSDVDGDNLTVSLVTGTSNGTLSLNSDGAFSYTPNLNFNSTDSFIYQVSDGNGGTAQASVTLTVNAVNDMPLALDDSYSFAEDFTWVRAVTDGDQLLSNDTDADGDVLTVNTTPVSGVSNGTLTLNSDGSFTYIPDADFFSQDSFTYEISDGKGGTAQASVTLIVNAVNDIPVVVSNTKSFTFDEDITLSKLATDADNLLSGASDVEGDSLTVTLDSGVTNNGSLTVNNDGSFQYIPNLNINGIDADTFTYQVSDGNGGVSETITVALNIQAVNDAPIPDTSPYTFSIDEGESVGDVVGTVSATDIENDTLAYSLSAGDTSLFTIDPSTGVITAKGTNLLDFETTIQHTLTVTITDDGSPIAESADVSVTININNIAEVGELTEDATFGRPIIGSLELTGIKTQAQLTDSITVAGVVYFLGTIDNVDKDVYMTAYNQDGTLNLAFGNSGIKVFDFGHHEYGKAIIHDTNSFYIAFDRDDGTYTEVCFLKIDNIGAFVTAFGDNGLSCTTEQKIFSINDLMYDDFDILAVGKVQGTDADTLVIQVNEDTGAFFDHTTDPTTIHLIQDVSGLGLDDEAIAVYRPNTWDIMITGNVVTAGGDSDIFAWHLDSDGNPITTFNGDGSPKFYDVSGSNDQVHAIGGKFANNFTAILAGSTVLDSGAKEALLLAIDKTGALVTSFDTDGIATYDVDGDADAGTGYAEFTAIVESTGNLYVSGTLYDGQVDFQNKPFTTRISKADGAIDGTYGVSGYQKIAYASDNAFALSMNLDNAQTMWLTGYVEAGSDKNMAISTVDSTGALFTGNNIVDGKLTLMHSSKPSDDTVAQVIQIQNGAQLGKYLTASTADDATDKHIILTRLTSAGALDTSFDSDGHKRLKVGTSATVKGIFELSTGSFIVYGNVTETGVVNGFVARIDQNGLLDTSFATNGIYTTSAISATNIEFNQVKADSSERLVAVGNLESGSISAFVLRLTAEGILDTTFNTIGHNTGAVTDDYMAVAIDSIDNIYAAGNRANVDKDILLVKYLATGLLDNTFNSALGELIIDIAGADDNVEFLGFDSINNLYLVGNNLATPNQVAVVKTTTSGALVSSFAGVGKASFSMAPPLYSSGMTSAIIDSNDNIVIAGFSDFLSGRRHMLGRIKPDGSLDNTFDFDGYFRASTCSNTAQIESIVLLTNSSFVVAGQCYINAIETNNIDISHYQSN